MGISFKNWPFQALETQVGLIFNTYFSWDIWHKKMNVNCVCFWKQWQFFGKLKTWFGQYYISIVLIEAWNFKIGFAIHISESIRGKPKCLEKELSSSQYSKANSTNSMVYQEIFMTCQPRYWNTVKWVSKLIIFLLILCNKKGFIDVLLYLYLPNLNILFYLQVFSMPHPTSLHAS